MNDLTQLKSCVGYEIEFLAISGKIVKGSIIKVDEDYLYYDDFSCDLRKTISLDNILGIISLKPFYSARALGGSCSKGVFL